VGGKGSGGEWDRGSVVGRGVEEAEGKGGGEEGG